MFLGPGPGRLGFGLGGTRAQAGPGSVSARFARGFGGAGVAGGGGGERGKVHSPWSVVPVILP